MENCNLRKYCCTFMVKMMMPAAIAAAASLNLQPINLQFVQKLAILQLYKIFLFHWWYDGGVKSSVSSIFLHTVIFSYSYNIILLLLFWTFVMDGFFLVNCSMTGKTLSCHWSSKIRLLWWYCTAYNTWFWQFFKGVIIVQNQAFQLLELGQSDASLGCQGRKGPTPRY